MSRSVVAAVILLVLVSTAGLAAGPDFAGMQLQAYDPPKPTPRFVFPDLSGKTVTLDDVKGKVTMLVFWATW